MSNDPFDIFLDEPVQEYQEPEPLSFETEAVEEVSKPTNPSVASSSNDSNYENYIYKKWYKINSQQGFLTVNGWLEAGKISIDIGEIKGELVSTKVWTDAIDFAAWLRNAIASDFNVKDYVHYGGSKSTGSPVSRIFKAEASDDKSYYTFKCGHFKASVNDQGGFIPDMKSPLSKTTIRMRPPELHRLAYLLDLAINTFAVKYNGDYLKALNGENK